MSNSGDNQRGQGQQKEDQQQGYQDDWSSAFDHLLNHEDGDQGHMNGVTNDQGHMNGVANDQAHMSGVASNQGHMNGVTNEQGHMNGVSNNPFAPYPILVHPSQQQTPAYTIPSAGTSVTNTYLTHPGQNQLTVATSSVRTPYPTTHPTITEINRPAAPTPTSTPSLQSTSCVAAAAAAAAAVSSPALPSDTGSVTGTDGDEGQGTKGKAACERKRNREKQRRNDVNQQFTDLTSLLKSIEETEDHEYEADSAEFGVEGGKKQRLGKGFYGRTGPTNRIDLIARTIVVLKHVWTESRDRCNEIKNLKHQLKQAKDELSKAKSDAASSSAQNKPDTKEQPMMMMVPMMMPANSSCGGGTQNPMAMQNPMQAFMGQMAQQQQGFMPFPFMSSHQSFITPQNPSGNMAMPQGVQAQQHQQQYHHQLQQQQLTQQQLTQHQQSIQHLQAQVPQIPPMNFAQGLTHNVHPSSPSQREEQAAQNVPSHESASGASPAPDSPNASASEEAKQQSGDESGGQGSNNNLAHCA